MVKKQRHDENYSYLPQDMVSHTTDEPDSFSKAKSKPTVNEDVISATKAKGNRLIHCGISDTNTPQLHYPLYLRSTKCDLVSVGFPGVELDEIMGMYLLC